MKKTRRLNGYVLVYAPEHKAAISSGGEAGYVYEHVLVAESSIGRSLRKSEEVHHLDLNRANNSPRNLVVLSRKAHMQLHAWLRNGAPIAGVSNTLSSKVKPIVSGTKRYSKLINRCDFCKNPTVPENKFCSNTCSQKSSRKIEVSVKKMSKLIESGMPWTQIGKTLGVSDNGARKIARRLGLL